MHTGTFFLKPTARAFGFTVEPQDDARRTRSREGFLTHSIHEDTDSQLHAENMSSYRQKASGMKRPAQATRLSGAVYETESESDVEDLQPAKGAQLSENSHADQEGSSGGPTDDERGDSATRKAKTNGRLGLKKGEKIKEATSCVSPQTVVQRSALPSVQLQPPKSRSGCTPSLDGLLRLRRLRPRVR